MEFRGFAIAAVALLSANLAFGGDVVPLKDKKDKVSYGIGMSFGTNLKANLKNDGIEVDQELILRGMKDALSGAPTALDETQLREVMNNLQAEVTAKQDARAKAAVEKAKGWKVQTQIVPAGAFWAAEEYHQEFIAKNGAFCHVKNPW